MTTNLLPHLFFKIIHNAQLNETQHLLGLRRWTTIQTNIHSYLCTDTAIKNTLYGNADYVVYTTLFVSIIAATFLLLQSLLKIFILHESSVSEKPS